jgi:hypothetical protein
MIEILNGESRKMRNVTLPESFYEIASERNAEEARRERRAKHWLTGLGIKARVAKLREYFGRMNEADIAYLRRDGKIAEAVSDLRRLSSELATLADALEPDPEEQRLLARAREGMEEEAA